MSRAEKNHDPTVIFVISDVGLNGHTLDAFDIGSALQRHGTRVILVIDDSGFNPGEHGYDFSVIGVENESMVSGRESSRAAADPHLSGVVRPIVHVWNTRATLFGLKLARQLRCGLVVTLCSGNTPRLLRLETPRCRNLVVISEHHQHALRRLKRFQSSDSSVDLIFERIPTAADRSDARQLFAATMRELGWPEDACLVLRVARFDRAYLPSVLIGIELVELLRSGGLDAYFLHVGRRRSSRHSTEVEAKVEEVMAETNYAAGDLIAASTADLATVGYRLAAGADVVVASDKAAMEGVRAGVPTVVVESLTGRMQGLVDPSNIASLAATNFARSVGPTKHTTEVADRLFDLFSTRGKLTAYRSWAVSDAEQRFSSEIGAEKYLDVYRQQQGRVPRLGDIRREAFRRACERASIPFRHAVLHLRQQLA